MGNPYQPTVEALEAQIASLKTELDRIDRSRNSVYSRLVTARRTLAGLQELFGVDEDEEPDHPEPSEAPADVSTEADAEPRRDATELELEASAEAASGGSADLSLRRITEGRPLYRSGVLQIMSTNRGTTWRIADVQEEMAKLGWISSENKNPLETIRGVADSLVKSGQLLKVGRGLYRLTPDDRASLAGEEAM